MLLASIIEEVTRMNKSTLLKFSLVAICLIVTQLVSMAPFIIAACVFCCMYYVLHIPSTGSIAVSLLLWGSLKYAVSNFIEILFYFLRTFNCLNKEVDEYIEYALRYMPKGAHETLRDAFGMAENEDKIKK